MPEAYVHPLSNEDFLTLRSLRKKAGNDQVLQDILAPYEHGAAAREAVAENPLMALPYAVGTLAYQPAKALGLIKGRSAPAVGQMIEGFRGIGQGLDQASAPYRQLLAERLRQLTGD